VGSTPPDRHVLFGLVKVPLLSICTGRYRARAAVFQLRVGVASLVRVPLAGASRTTWAGLVGLMTSVQVGSQSPAGSARTRQ